MLLGMNYSPSTVAGMTRGSVNDAGWGKTVTQMASDLKSEVGDSLALYNIPEIRNAKADK